MTFDHPGWLVGGAIAAIVFALLYRRIANTAKSRALTYSNLAFASGAMQSGARYDRFFVAGWIAGIALIVSALAHPHVTTWVAAKNGAAMICIDTSGSMSSTDVAPTRWDAAKIAAREFINQTPMGTKIGIITFASEAMVVAPLSADRQQVLSALDNVPPPNGGTAIGDALQLALSGLPKTGPRTVVLITDGVANRGTDPMEAARNLGTQGIKLYTIGIGTNSGALVPGTNVEATIDEDALRAYADATGGSYARADNATALRSALARLGRTTTLERRRADISLGTAIAGALLLAATFLTGLALGRYA
ncbi:MAG: VWA domain-containing protein [Candidatus Eremiobacteraeota bacterium]|nr:VWA domain-containing protein [Candidatus Eremiobacteraeota bacterium]